MSYPSHTPVGIYSALPTPFTAEGEVDIDQMLALMAWQLNPTSAREPKMQNINPTWSGVSGFVLYGTTGEASTLSMTEREEMTRAAAERFPHTQLIAGVGSNCTRSSIELARQARSWGATGGLVVTPYYNKPSQEGLYRHFSMIAESCSEWPLTLYTVPSRAAVTLEVNTLNRLLNTYSNIRAIKDATADLSYGAELISCCEGRAHVLSGDDPTALAAWSLGAQGSISVISNLIPAEFVSLWEHHIAGHHPQARRLFLDLHPLIRSMFIESNPVPLKKTLALWSAEALIPVPLWSAQVRAPLAELSEDHYEQLMITLNHWRGEQIS
jgi:4-hydroxy-tetrahydrodipicolinate synthase